QCPGTAEVHDARGPVLPVEPSAHWCLEVAAARDAGHGVSVLLRDLPGLHARVRSMLPVPWPPHRLSQAVLSSTVPQLAFFSCLGLLPGGGLSALVADHVALHGRAARSRPACSFGHFPFPPPSLIVFLRASRCAFLAGAVRAS